MVVYTLTEPVDDFDALTSLPDWITADPVARTHWVLQAVLALADVADYVRCAAVGSGSRAHTSWSRFSARRRLRTPLVSGNRPTPLVSGNRPREGGRSPPSSGGLVDMSAAGLVDTFRRVEMPVTGVSASVNRAAVRWIGQPRPHVVVEIFGEPRPRHRLDRRRVAYRRPSGLRRGGCRVAYGRRRVSGGRVPGRLPTGVGARRAGAGSPTGRCGVAGRRRPGRGNRRVPQRAAPGSPCPGSAQGLAGDRGSQHGRDTATHDRGCQPDARRLPRAARPAQPHGYDHAEQQGQPELGRRTGERP